MYKLTESRLFYVTRKVMSGNTFTVGATLFNSVHVQRQETNSALTVLIQVT